MRNSSSVSSVRSSTSAAAEQQREQREQQQCKDPPPPPADFHAFVLLRRPSIALPSTPSRAYLSTAFAANRLPRTVLNAVCPSMVVVNPAAKQTCGFHL